MMTFPVRVQQLSPTSSEKSIHDFFSFCGRIASIQFDASTHTATINFEKIQAAKTALMLNGGALDGATIHVSSDSVADEHHDDTTTHGVAGSAAPEGSAYEQHDKPRAGIAAELLAKGYVLSETILGKAIEIDHKQGISTRFLNYIRGLDKTIGEKIGGPETTVSGKAKEVYAQGHAQARSIDETHGISKQAGDYYSRAIASPFGVKVMEFYTGTKKQVQDVHEEALRIAAAEKEAAATSAATTAAHNPDAPAAVPTTSAPGYSS
ncbi:hypothetical protein FRC14_005553 [Serendipita sp. 396]|nr:hypothetical protein FRC14_005553 [Serendipita sp. 396]KAG8789268.1 hypothetical protein FRC15_010104 [Serendipita sp. 397]KAG8804488.1 hypothetical protein FRC16_007897 [Serendipita sp. 398]KAG8827548.1 hypothetical protein FRC19_002241 [Serendipita sp. 401]KAG8878446.1 hypothetical protein FRC20_008369 [Serendipita sp. 405]KAG9057971.1 hypothetical protein FS842_002663 [Serendipita sp. 407]